MSAKGWSAPFDDPIFLPGGSALTTLRAAGTYISELPDGEQDKPEWQIATEVLMLVVETGGPTMMARIGIMRALNAGKARRQETRQRSHVGGHQASGFLVRYAVQDRNPSIP